MQIYSYQGSLNTNKDSFMIPSERGGTPICRKHG